MGYQLNSNIKIFSASQIMLNKVNTLIKKNIVNKTSNSKKINFAIVAEQSYYEYIKQNTINKYDNVNFYWIYDNLRPNNIDYFIIGSINNNDELLKNINKLNKWISLNQKAKFLLTSSDVVNVENIDNIVNITPKMIIRLIFNLMNKEMFRRKLKVNKLKMKI